MRCTMAFFSAAFFLTITSLRKTRSKSGILRIIPSLKNFPREDKSTYIFAPRRFRSSAAMKTGLASTWAENKVATLGDMKARFGRCSNSCELRITGGPRNDLTITVQVPKKSNLVVRIFAGDVEVKGITGNKDIELHAGDLTIGVGDPSDYAHVQASVTTGEIDAKPFGESHGGLFRSFEKSGNGKYKLMAHVAAGDLTLN